MEDGLADISDVFADPDLTNVNPMVENKTLIAAVEFVSRISEARTVAGGDVFNPFWLTLVAGRDGTDSQRAPASL